MRALSPPLSVLEESLFGPSETLLRKIAFSPETVADDLRQSVLGKPRYAEMIDALRTSSPEDDDIADEAPPMPGWLRDLIERRCQAQSARFSEQPQPGQIRLVTQVIGPDGPLGLDLGHPLSVCLDRPYFADKTIWHGWLVTPETDYAGYWDVLIEDTDGPCDPQAGMVQITAPVYLFLPSAERVIGQLSDERLAAIRSVAAEMLSDMQPEEAPRPGFMLVRQTLNNHSVLTGTPLGGDDDPRWRYRSLYKDMLPALYEPVRLAMDGVTLSSVAKAAGSFGALPL